MYEYSSTSTISPNHKPSIVIQYINKLFLTMSHGLCDLSSPPEIEPRAPAVKAPSPNYQGIPYINKVNNKNHMIVSIDVEKAFNKIQHPFITTTTKKKTFNKVSVERTYFNIIKAIYDKPTVNIIPSCETLKTFLLTSGTRQGCSFLPLLFNIVLEVLITVIKL